MMLTLDILGEERSWESLSCSAHTLQLYLKTGFDIPAISRLLACARKLVGHFHHSVVATEALKQKQTEMNVVGKKLVRDCVTRWNSSYFMLDRLVKLRWPVTAVLSDETVTKRSDQFLDLKTEQWNISAELLKVLEPFDIATTFFSYEENPSISCVLPVLHGLMEKLSISSDDLTEVRQFKQKVKAEITRRWSFDSLDGDNILVLGCILDPRFKQVKFLSDDGKESVKQEIVNRMENIMITEEPDDDDDATDDSEPASKRQKTTALDKLLGPETKSNVLTNREELDAFMSMPQHLIIVHHAIGGAPMLAGFQSSTR